LQNLNPRNLDKRKISSQRTIVFWCEHPFQIYASKFLVCKYKKSRCAVIFFTYKKHFIKAQSYLGLAGHELNDIDRHISKIGTILTRLFKVYLVPQNFTELYFLRINKRSPSIFFRSINKVTSAFTSDYNYTYHRLIKVFIKLKFLKPIKIPVDLLISFTKVYHSYLLVPFSEKHISIMESWDHPSKEPFLIYPKVSMTWNQDLQKEIRDIQKCSCVRTMKPIKFSYISERKEKVDDKIKSAINNPMLLKDLELFNKFSLVVYPVCTSSKYYAFEGELRFIEDLASIVSNLGHTLYIRPYPIGTDSDVKQLELIDNVIVGCNYSLNDGSDVLNEQLLSHKYLIMKNAHFIINVGTTFALDAAYLGKPVVQVSIDSDTYGSFSQYSKGVHIRKYLLNKHSISFDNHLDTMDKSILLEKGQAFTSVMNSWLNNQMSIYDID